jgi:hypothetical protein
VVPKMKEVPRHATSTANWRQRSSQS